MFVFFENLDLSFLLLSFVLLFFFDDKIEVLRFSRLTLIIVNR